MDIEVFWQLIDSTREAAGDDAAKQADLLVEIMIDRSIAEIFAFEDIMDDLLDNAYDAALWDAAYIIGCGCSDDGFYEFRGWLIAQGKEVYENALSDPESLLGVLDVDEDGKDGYILSVVYNAYELKAGHIIPITPERIRNPPILKGNHWKEEDISSRFPKLTAKFGDCDERWRKWIEEDFSNQT